MAERSKLENVASLAREIKERVCLPSRPIGLSVLGHADEMCDGAKRPSRRGMTSPVCLAANQVRTMGWTIGITLEDHFCVFAAAGLGHMELPEYLRNGRMGSHHTITKELGINIQENLERKCFFRPGSTRGIMLTPATEPKFLPQGVVIYGNPSQIGKIAKAVAWYTGRTVPVSAGGFGGCIVAAAAIRDKKCAIVMPCSGEKIMGHTEENDIFLACPTEDLPKIVEGMKETDFILPYPTAKYLMFEPRVPKDYPIDYQSYREHMKKR
jgi:uncharacterized protein (DUF169 family)